MASSIESSNIKNVIKIPAKRIKHPDKAPSPPTTPKSSLQSVLSYVDTRRSTPTPDVFLTPKQTLGKRMAEDRSDGTRRPPPSHPKTPSRRASLPHIPLAHHQTRSLSNSPEPQDQDLDMEDPFLEPTPNSHQNPVEEKDEDERFLDRLSNIQGLLKKIHLEFNSARYENFLNDIIKNPEVADYMEDLATLIPNPVMTGIAHIQKLVEKLTEKTFKTEWNNPPDRSTHSSAYASVTSSREPDRPPRAYSNVLNSTNVTSPPQPNTTTKTPPKPKQEKPAPTNPNAAHHPSRLVVQFLPTGIPEDLRLDPSKMVLDLNAAIARNHPSRTVRIVAASFNPQGNLILSTRADQTANEILRYRDSVISVIANLGYTQNIELHEDKKWYKIQIDAVNTSSISIGNERVPTSEETVHKELLECNPQYALMKDSIVSKPRWLRSKEELLTTPRSSLVFATSDEEAAKRLLKSRSLAAFGRHCFVRAFQDRPPVTQCKNCWRLDHPTHRCKEDPQCRLCSGPHDEKDHHHNEPSNCQRCLLALEMGDTMDTSAEGFCPHEIRCINCLGNSNVDHDHPADARRCPARLEKYGTARDNERRNANAGNPWMKAKPPKKQSAKNIPEGPTATGSTSQAHRRPTEPTQQIPMEP